MTFGANSAIFKAYVADCLTGTLAANAHISSGGTWQACLFTDTGTPDNRVASANTAYNAGAWASGNEVSSGIWPAKGRPLVWGSATRWTSGTGDDYSTFDADDTAGTGSGTVSGAFGDFIFDDALATGVTDQGLCYHSFGGSKGVSGGTFTIQWHANGVCRWTHTAAA